MVFSEVFQRFVEARPACVMYRAVLEKVFAPARLDALFRQVAQAQYQRELLFSTLVELTSQVTCRSTPSIHSAYQRQRERILVSIRAVYDKLSLVEPDTSRAMVRYVAEQAAELIGYAKGTRRPLLRNYRVRILDGNHLGKTEHRLGVLRNTAAGALPGQSLVVLDPQRMIIDDVVCCEDGHAQERTLVDQLDIQKRDLIIDDRNFCTLRFSFLILGRKACFLTRQHANFPWKPVQKPQSRGRGATGRVSEQQIEICDPETGRTRQIRRVTVKLNTPTQDGDKEIHLVTNLPVSAASAVKVAELYRQRWTVEQAFQELTVSLRCELNTLGYPKAALFSFCVAVCSYNLLAIIKGALRGIHGEETLETRVSNFHLTSEISGAYDGMMVAIPQAEWEVFQDLRPKQLAAQLRDWAAAINLSRYPKHPRGPKKPKPKPPNAQFQHVATAKLLDDERQRRKRKQPKHNTP